MSRFSVAPAFEQMSLGLVKRAKAPPLQLSPLFCVLLRLFLVGRSFGLASEATLHT